MSDPQPPVAGPTPPDTPQPRGAGKPASPGRAMKIVLGLSLALNLAVIGAVGGVILGGGPGRGGDGPPGLRSLGFGPFASVLSRQDRAEISEQLRGREDALREDRRALGRALRDVQQALRAEPFDRAAAEAALADTRARAEGLQEAGHRALLDQFERMSTAERRAVADDLDRVMRRAGGVRSGPGGGGRDN